MAVSSGNFGEALAALLDPKGPLVCRSSPPRVCKEGWKADLARERFQGRDLNRKRYGYLLADDVYFNMRLKETKQCILVIIGADEDSRKELVDNLATRKVSSPGGSAAPGAKCRRLTAPPQLAIVDSEALEFWNALWKVYGSVRQQH
jgi:hypothetical protein